MDKIRRLAMPSESLVSKAAFKFHLKNKEKVAKVKDWETFNRICREIFKVVAEWMVEEASGVVLRRWGYFYIWMYPKKKVLRNFLGVHINSHTDGYVYTPVLDSSVLPRDTLKGWYIEEAFSRKVVRGMVKKLKQGFKYRTHIGLAKSMLKMGMG